MITKITKKFQVVLLVKCSNKREVFLHLIYFTEKKHISTADSSTVEWEITDIAGPSQLGTRERLQYKKDMYGELLSQNNNIA